MERLSPKVEYNFTNGDNRVATLNDVNQVIDQLNVSAPYDLIGARLNHSVGQPPSIIVVSSVGCQPQNCSCKKKVNCLTISNLSVGNYTITMSTPPANGFDVLISPLKDARQNIGIEKVSSTEIIVSVYDIPSGSYVNNAFDNTYIQFLLWN